MKPVIITGCSAKFMRPFMLSFMPTLRQYEPSIPVAFMDYYNLQPSGVQHYIEAPRGSNLLRRFHLSGREVANFLMCTPYTHALVVCAGDVWFQGKLDELWWSIPDQNRVYLTPENGRCNEHWFQRQLSVFPEALREDISRHTGDRRMLNGGVIAGRIGAMVQFLNQRHALTLAADTYSGFAVDQVMTNYLAAMAPSQFGLLPRKFNYMPAQFPWTQDGEWLLDDEGRRPTVCHNAGHRPFPRRVAGELIDLPNEYNT